MEFYQSKCGKYKIECLTKSTAAGALKVYCKGEDIKKQVPGAGLSARVASVQVMKEAFCQDEAVCKGCEIDSNPAAADELLELCADAALDNASLVAIEISSGSVVAAAFNKIQIAVKDSKPFFEVFAEERCSQESSKSLVFFMADADSQCDLFSKYGVDCSLEIMFLATLREHRGHDLATLLCKASIDLARKFKDGPIVVLTPDDLGPKYAMLKTNNYNTYPKICSAIWTAGASQRVGQKLNFKVEKRISFKEYTHNGKSYFERLGGEPAFCEIAAVSLY